MLKKFLAVLVLIGVVLPIISTTASAANNIVTCKTLDAIPEDLEIFKTIRDGRISAVKSGGNWYYQFTRSGQKTVRIHVNAFQTKPANGNLDKDNAALNANLKKDLKHNWDRVCYYNTMDSQWNYVNGNKFKVYHVDMYRLVLQVGCTDMDFTTRCTLTHGVSFSYSTKVLATTNSGYTVPSRDYSTLPERYRYVEPSTADQYLRALSRSTAVCKLTPVMEVAVENTGKRDTELSKYYVVGEGNAATTAKELRGLINVFSAAGKLGAMFFNPEATFVKWTAAAFGFATSLEDMASLKKDGKRYHTNTGEAQWLSRNNKHIYGTVYTSPIKLESGGNWIQIETRFNTELENGMMHVGFSFR